jgi:2-keto-4-pentenoate hydratase/2-oxohepta-3-ene-1,7-dioic acid hydratase in catechol pathway
MKIVVFGPDKRTGAVHDGNIVDLSYACAKYVREREGEPSPLQTAEALVPSDLGRLIEGGPRALEHAQKALDYLFGEAQNKLGPHGETLVYPAASVRVHAPRPNNARIACAGGNFADHAAAMAVKMRRRPYEGDAYQEIRKAGFWGFWKLAREIVGPGGELVYPERCNRLDYEGEIAIVLGKRGVDLKPAQLTDYVWGVTMLGDWSIRAPGGLPGGPLNFAFPKNFDTSCSLGPCIAVGRDRPDQCRYGNLGQWRASSALQHARHGIHLWRIPRASVARLHALSGRHHQRRNGSRYGSRFERVAAGRQLCAGAFSQTRRLGGDDLALDRLAANPRRRQE